MNECGTKICNYISQFYDLVAASNDKGKFELDCLYYDFSSVEKIITDKMIDTVVIFNFDKIDVELLHKRMFTIVSKNTQIKNMIFIEERDIFRKRKVERSVFELLCNEYTERFNINTKIIYTSCLYGTELLPKYIVEKIKELFATNTITPAGNETEFCDCLHIDDFCDALHKILDCYDSSMNMSRIELQSGYPFSLQELIECIHDEYKQTTILPYNEVFTESYNSTTLLENWTPKHGFLADRKHSFEIAESQYSDAHRTKHKKWLNTLLLILGFLSVFALVEIYTRFITVSSDLQFVDLRLLFIVSCSLILGKKFGLVSAGLCSMASIIQGLTNGYRWYVLFYHVDNWIPLAVYIIVAIAIGNYREKLIERDNSKNE